MERAEKEPDVVDRDAAESPARCVWMLAGVVSYRLCNRAFDCDHCPLDRALREGARTPQGRALNDSLFPARQSCGKTASHLFVD